MTRRFGASIAVALVLAAAPLVAHHTIAGVYDPDKRATLSGTIADVQWRQPHVRVRMDVKAEDGHIVQWLVETQAPLVLQSHGLRPDVLKPGMMISSTVCLARDGSHSGYAQNFVLPDGAGTIISFGCLSVRSTP